MNQASIQDFDGISPKLGKRVYISDHAVVIGRVSLGDDTSVWPMCVIRGDVNEISIGHRSNIQDGTIIHVSRKGGDHAEGFPTHIGDDVTVGHKVMLHGCIIGDRCLIGMGAMIMDGAVIEAEVLVAAGSLVAPGKKLESGYLYQGRPARRMRKLSSEERERLLVGAKHYVSLKDKYRTDV